MNEKGLSMNEVTVFEHKFGGEMINSVDARELHGKLNVTTYFTTWIQRRIEEAQLVEGQDFASLSKVEVSGQTSKEYVLSLDSAKHVAMLERTEKGREIRQYFIDFEKKIKKIAEKPMSLAETFRYMARLADEQEAMKEEQSKQEQKIKQIEAKQEAILGFTGYFSVVAYARITNKHVNLETAQCLGRMATKLSKEENLEIGKVKDQRHGYIGTYHESILKKVFEDFFSEECHDYEDLMF